MKGLLTHSLKKSRGVSFHIWNLDLDVWVNEMSGLR